MLLGTSFSFYLRVPMAGRKQDVVWLKFKRITTAGKAGCKAECLRCHKVMQGLVARLKQHVDSCNQTLAENDFDIMDLSDEPHLSSDISSSTPSSSASVCVTAGEPKIAVKRQNTGMTVTNSIGKTSVSSASIPTSITGEPKPKAKRQDTVTDFVVKTSQSDKDALDLQLARFVYSTNIPFSVVEHPEFKKLMTMLRPGYRPPTRYDVSGKLLDNVQADLMSQCTEELLDQTVSMSLDGWSNIHNDPIICASITTDRGRSFLAETIDTSGKSHTSDYLHEITKTVIQECEMKFKCHVRSFVTDNAANMSRMRRELKDNDDVNVITYGCSAHYLNLLAKDVEVSGVRDHLLPVIKYQYFRN